MRKCKVQTNEFKVNILVEHEDCSGRHYSSFDKNVLCEKLSDDEIELEFSKLELSIEDKKQFLKKVKGFAISHVSSKENEISYNDLFRYKLLK